MIVITYAGKRWYSQYGTHGNEVDVRHVLFVCCMCIMHYKRVKWRTCLFTKLRSHLIDVNAVRHNGRQCRHKCTIKWRERKKKRKIKQQHKNPLK